MCSSSSAAPAPCVDVEDLNNNSSTREKSYSLRPRSSSKRDVNEEDSSMGIFWRKRGRAKRKPKLAPLSKYRRKTANARERSRMREINEAFDSLRRVVPHSCGTEKLTKISTLRLAMQYITALTDALNTENVRPVSPEASSSTATVKIFLSPMVECFPPTPPVSDSPLTPPSLQAEVFDSFDTFQTPLDLDDFFLT